MNNLILLVLAFMKVAAEMSVSLIVSSVVLCLMLSVKGFRSESKSFYNRFISEGK